MANKKRNPAVRQSYLKRFIDRYKMTMQEWRELKKSDKQRAHDIRMKLQEK